MNIEQYWTDVLKQNGKSMRGWFKPDACINWHNTNECFTVEEFIRANCEYPGEWAGEIEKKVVTDDLIITAVHVYTQNNNLHFHVTSFIHITDGKIASIDEYWGNDGDAPQWRKELNIGSRIK